MNRSLTRAFTTLAALTFSAAATAQNDRINDEPTGWWYWYGVPQATIDAEIAANRRPFNITATGGNYDAVLVANTGEYAATGMDVVWNSSTSTINLSLNLSNNRIIDLEPVNTLTNTWSAVVVDNSGPTAAPGWDWATGLTYDQLIAWQAGNSLRPIDVDQYPTIAGTRYSIVAVPNTGNNFQAGWWWYFNVLAGEVGAALNTNGARLIDIDIASTGPGPVRYNALMVSENPGGGWWHYGLTSAEVTDFLNQRGARLTCLERYTTTSGDTLFAIAAVDNVNTQSRRLRDYMDSDIASGVYGFRVKQVGGPVIAALNDTFQYEAASSLKILHAAYATSACATGFDNLSADILIRDTCNNDECPSPIEPCNTATEDLVDAIRDMMENSDNNRTMEIELRYGRTTLNNYADSLGLTGTHINHRMGCGGVFNTFTCVDACHLYERIADGSLFNQTWQDTLYELMSNEDGHNWMLAPIINEEAANTSLTASELADFKDQTPWACKSGSYDFSGIHYRPESGWIRIPYKTLFMGQWVLLPREYTTAAFVHGATIPYNSAYYIKFEGVREQLREALQSWDNACTPPTIADQPDPLAATEGEDVSFNLLLNPGAGPRTYQWQKQINGIYTNLANAPGAVEGVTTNTLSLLDVNEADQSRYRCVITSACGNVTSAAALLTVNPPSPCDSIDFNGDGLFPDVQDIADFIAVFGGAPCPTTSCGDIDFNNDGLLPDIADIETLIRVFSGGPCQ